MNKPYALVLASLLSAFAAYGQLVDFEALPNGSPPTPGMAISNQYASAYGLSFQCDNGSYPVVSQSGVPNPYAFIGPNNVTNAPAANQEVGKFFITSNPGLLYTKSQSIAFNLIVTYQSPVANASGVILDIDSDPDEGGPEAWNVRAFNGTNLLSTILLTTNTPNTGDGVSTPWTFVHTNADITSVRIEYAGAKTNGIGFAFDNFSPAFINPPSALTIQQTNGAARLGVTGTNSYYHLDWTISLNPASWQPLADVYLTNEPYASIVDASSIGAAQRFYRAMPLAAPCVAPPSGLVAWWPGDGSGADLTGNYPGTLSDVTFLPGKVGQTFSFNGSNSGVVTHLDVRPAVMSNTTWEAWVYPTCANYSNGQPILSDAQSTGPYWRTLTIETNSTFGISTGATTPSWKPVVASFNEWQHLAVIYSPNYVLFYKNGVAYSNATVSPMTPTTNFLFIGENPGTGNHFQGMIDEVSIYSNVLSASEIQAIYRAGATGKCK